MKYRTVQTMMLPDCAEENYGLYYQGTGGIQVQQGEKKSLSVPENEKADLFTYFNGFYPKQWSQYAQLDGLRIKVTVSGNCRVLLCHIDGSRTVVDEEKESRTAADIKNELVFEVSDVIENNTEGQDKFIASLVLAKEIARILNGRAVLMCD